MRQRVPMGRRLPKSVLVIRDSSLWAFLRHQRWSVCATCTQYRCPRVTAAPLATATGLLVLLSTHYRRPGTDTTSTDAPYSCRLWLRLRCYLLCHWRVTCTATCFAARNATTYRSAPPLIVRPVFIMPPHPLLQLCRHLLPRVCVWLLLAE